jgi:hypothetical protein
MTSAVELLHSRESSRYGVCLFGKGQNFRRRILSSRDSAEAWLCRTTWPAMWALSPRTTPYVFQQSSSYSHSSQHFVENIGDEPVEMLEVFRADKFQDFSLNQWLALTRPDDGRGALQPHGREEEGVSRLAQGRQGADQAGRVGAGLAFVCLAIACIMRWTRRARPFRLA